MKYKSSFTLICLLITIFSAKAQQQLPMASNIKAAFDKGTRSSNGEPGKSYWQNSADYDIKINFVPNTRLLSGTADITYTNNSPDTLKEIVFKLYPNLYKAGSMRAYPVEPEDVGEGMNIQKILVDKKPANVASALVRGTNMSLPVQPVAPKRTVHLSLDFSYILNKKSHIRTGEVEDGAYFIAYFFPRVTVYDDIDGWNMNPYLGTAEFYNDFCNFKVAITVPKNYVVWATGALQNCAEVLKPAICSKILQAEKNDAIIYVIDSNDVKSGNVTTDAPTNTFQYSATTVSDFVFATSDHYVWQSSSVLVDSATGRRTRVDAAYNQNHKDYYRVASDAHETVKLMSHYFPKWPYPYPHETVFDGLDEMEYPMMVNEIPLADLEANVQLTNHEIFHTMFPFYMGVNETKYGWMDEGWGTIGEWLLSPKILAGIIDYYGMDPYEKAAGTEVDMPIMTLTNQMQGIYYERQTAFFVNSYPKPALGYLYVRDLLGDDLFIKALHTYIRNWNGKHPIPYDFFNSINTGAGKNLNWFWKSWFFDTGFPDLGIKSVSAKGKQLNISIIRKGSKPVPVDVTIVYTDGSTEQIHRTISVWETGTTSLELTHNISKTVKQVNLGSLYIPDVDKKDNNWTVK